MPTEEEIQKARSRWRRNAYAFNNGQFICIKTYSGYTRSFGDPDVPEYVLEPQVDDEGLGCAVLDALGNSRFVSYDEETELIENMEPRYDQWVQTLMKQYGYKTKKALFKNMKSCGFDCKDDVIRIRPSHHDKLEYWSGDGFTEADYIKIPADSPPEQIGAALRLAFSRCTGMGAD